MSPMVEWSRAILVPLVLVGVVAAGVLHLDRGLERRDGHLLEAIERQRAALDGVADRLAAQSAGERPSRPAAAHAVAGAAPGPEGLAVEVGRAVQAALDDRAATERAAEEAELQPTSENDEAFEHAAQHMARIFESKRWTERDRDEMRSQLRRVSPNQKQELLQRAAIALNSGAVVVETQGPPL
jgi:hypothetical protein